MNDCGGSLGPCPGTTNNNQLRLETFLFYLTTCRADRPFGFRCQDLENNDVPPPSIDSFAPTCGTAGVTSVTITGRAFAPTPAVYFSGTPAAAPSVPTDNRIDVTVPAGAISGYITITTPGGTATSATQFTIPC